MTCIQPPSYTKNQIDQINENLPIKKDVQLKSNSFLSYYNLKCGNGIKDMILGVQSGVDLIECLGAQMNMLVCVNLYIIDYYSLNVGYLLDHLPL